MDRRSFLGLSALVLLAGCTSSPSPTSPSPTTATLGLTYIPNVQFSPAYVAEAHGAFGSQKVKLRHHGAQEGLFTALTAGEEQFVIAGGDEMVQAVGQGQDLVAIASYYAQNPVRVVVRRDSGIASLAQLKGHKVGVPGRYGTSWLGLLVALQTAGLTEQDIQVVEIGYTSVAAMTSKRVDALVGFTNNDTVQMKAAGLDVAELAVAADVPLAGACLITTRGFLRAHPDVVKAVRDGVVKGMAEVVANPAEAVEATKKYVPGLSEQAQADAARATINATLPLFRNPQTQQVDGAVDVGTWTRMIEFMREQKMIAKPVAVSDVVVNLT